MSGNDGQRSDGARPVPPIAVFDFDGTLTRRDTMIPFLVSAVGGHAVATALAGVIVTASRRGRRPQRDDLKTAAVRLLAGRAVDELADQAERYADRVEASGLRADTVGRLRWHAAQGHRVVVVSASLELYVGPVAARLTPSSPIEVLGTRLETVDGRYTGRIAGRNCRGAEKVGRLRELGVDAGVQWAYGDSRGDAEMLAYAERPLRIGRGRISPAP